MIDPCVWWQTFAFNQSLFAIASRVLTIPPSTAASERNWSVFSNTHTKTRNRLTKDRVNKLVTVRANLRLNDSVIYEKSSSDASETEEEYRITAPEPFEFAAFENFWSSDEN